MQGERSTGHLAGKHDVSPLWSFQWPGDGAVAQNVQQINSDSPKVYVTLSLSQVGRESLEGNKMGSKAAKELKEA